ncbi:type VI secretion system tip protein VgrG [Pseudenhygromyxa sp. WMMC2535]|uniref:type VI secretion system Vgr family protein n=1 Tax=Pseudenhygromyxa sp. WMMC2535 TaxID=2712867 RepID=UPI0015540310|nr:type VI secretion system tip protein TssI/VgrG [Pseudenhygromyxa sp. WMMC2535]NVB36432.1 type VI secretion system tip protein VgrG [Pseudenhygromyxa sp. WMMC2535]
MNDVEHPVTLRFGSDVDADVHWEVSNLYLSERLDAPYQLHLELRSDDPMAEAITMLGHSVSVSVERGPITRDFFGVVERVEDGASSNGRTLATLEVVPALVALGHRRTSRIFQELSVTDILQQVLGEGLEPFERRVDMGYLSGDYPPQEYTVQYKESDLDFVHRLMEEQGISYCFRHVDGAEVLTLFDDSSVYEDLVSFGNYDGVLPMTLAEGGAGTREDVRNFYRESRRQPTVARTAVFDWLSPHSTQTAEDDHSAELDINGAALDPEREDYVHEEPSTLLGYRSAGLDFAAVKEQTRLRRVVHQRDALRFFALTTATGLSPGVKFELLDHPQAEFEGIYVVVAVDHMAGDQAIGSLPEEAYTNRIECVPVDLEWRPTRQTPRPRIPSVQTATVVGPAGEEIHTDEHGRIKVQFHWSRETEYDENASCFIRVVQPWAGNGWGFVFLPRIGMEVAVTFIDGDPDRPVVTGCLYNGANTPPYPLPDDKTKSTIKSESSPGGGGFNELRFEDATGDEEIFIHAQKDFNEVVLNDHNTTVGNNQTNNVDVDQTQTVHGNQTETVDGDQVMTVHSNRTVTVDANFDETISGTETRNVTGDVSETFSANETRTISGDQSETITGSVTHTITGSQTDTITGALSQDITGGVTVNTPAAYSVTAQGGITLTAPAGYKLVAPGGTTVVDQFFDSYGAKKFTAYANTISLVGTKFDAVNVAIGVVNTKVDLVGIKVDVCAFKFTNSPAGVEAIPQKYKVGVIAAYMYAQSLFI